MNVCVAALSRSLAIIRPFGPVPCSCDRSIPLAAASDLASGLANMRPPVRVAGGALAAVTVVVGFGGCGTAACCAGGGAGAALFAGAAVGFLLAA